MKKNITHGFTAVAKNSEELNEMIFVHHINKLGGYLFLFRIGHKGTEFLLDNIFEEPKKTEAQLEAICSRLEEWSYNNGNILPTFKVVKAILHNRIAINLELIDKLIEMQQMLLKHNLPVDKDILRWIPEIGSGAIKDYYVNELKIKRIPKEVYELADKIGVMSDKMFVKYNGRTERILTNLAEQA